MAPCASWRLRRTCAAQRPEDASSCGHIDWQPNSQPCRALLRQHAPLPTLSRTVAAKSPSVTCFSDLTNPATADHSLALPATAVETGVLPGPHSQLLSLSKPQTSTSSLSSLPHIPVLPGRPPWLGWRQAPPAHRLLLSGVSVFHPLCPCPSSPSTEGLCRWLLMALVCWPFSIPWPSLSAPSSSH